MAHSVLWFRIQRRIKYLLDGVSYDPEPLEFQLMLISLVSALWFGWPGGVGFSFPSPLWTSLTAHLTPIIWALIFYSLFISKFCGLFFRGFILRFYASAAGACIWSVIVTFLYLGQSNSVGLVFFPVFALSEFWIHLRIKSYLLSQEAVAAVDPSINYSNDGFFIVEEVIDEPDEQLF